MRPGGGGGGERGEGGTGEPGPKEGGKGEGGKGRKWVIRRQDKRERLGGLKGMK